MHMKWLVAGAVGLVVVIGGAIFFALYLKTSLTGVPTQDKAFNGPATIITGAVLVRAPQELAIQMRDILEGGELSITPETPEPSPPNGEVLGVHTEDVLSFVPELQSVVATDITPAIARAPLAADEELADIDRWFIIALPIGEHEVNVINQQTLDLPEAVGGQASSPQDEVERNFVGPTPSPTPPPPSPEARQAVEQTKAVIASLKKSGRFEAVEPVLRVSTTAIPNDPYFSSGGSWDQPYDDLWGMKRIQAPAAWDITKGSSETIVAIVDTGIDFGHRDLQGNLYENLGEVGTDTQGQNKKTNGVDDDANGYIDDWRGWKFAYKSNNNNPYDDHGHGTHVAGTIAAVGNNETDVAGVMWQAKLLAVKFLGHDGYGRNVDGASAIRYAADRGARVINNSWGGPGFSQVVHDAVEYANAKGALVIAAAGNSGCDLALPTCNHFPANESNAVAVSALTPSDTLAWFSNFGHKIEFTAPGGDNVAALTSSILSLKITTEGISIGQSLPGTALTRLPGTSMAAPHVSGVAGLVFALHPDWTNSDVRKRLQETADDLGEAGRDQEFGFGLINAARAVDGPSVQASFTSPAEDSITSNSPVALVGSAGGQNFADYSLEVGQGYQPTIWQSVANSSTPVNSGQLGNWLPEHDFYTLRLTLNPSRQDRIQIIRHFGFDKEIKKGWPIELSRGWRVPLWFLSTPVLADIDGDGTKEIVVHPNTTHKISAFKSSGALIWEKGLEPNPWDFPLTLTAHDVNNDGQDNVIANSFSKIHILDQQGNDISGWPQSAVADEIFLGSPTIARLEPNTEPLLVGASINANQKTGHLYAWQKDGATVPGWPKAFTIPGKVIWPYYSAPSGISVRDTDGDGLEEIFFALPIYHDTNPKLVVYGFSANGQPLPNWPVILQEFEATNKRGILPGGLSIGDVTGDQTPEIVTVTSNGLIVALQPDGSFAPGWPKKLQAGPHQRHYFWGFPLLTDLSGDGILDIIVGEHHALSGSGTVIAGWEPLTGNSGSATMSYGPPVPVALSPAATGILNTEETKDWDGFEHGSRLVGYKNDGTSIPEWTKKIASFASSSPVTGDLDGDGQLEVVAIGVRNDRSYLFVWNKDITVQGETHEWPTLHGDSAHTHVFPHQSATPASGAAYFILPLEGSQTVKGDPMRMAVDLYYSGNVEVTNCRILIDGELAQESRFNKADVYYNACDSLVSPYKGGVIRSRFRDPSRNVNKKKVKVSGIFGSDSLEAGTHQWGFDAKLSDGSFVSIIRDFKIVNP